MKKWFLAKKKYLEEGVMGSSEYSDSEEDVVNRSKSKDQDYIPEKGSDTDSSSDSTAILLPTECCAPSNTGIGNSSKYPQVIMEEIMEQDLQNKTVIEEDSTNDTSQSQSEEIERDEDVGNESIKVDQLCIFCCQKFISKQDLLEHLPLCNPVIFYIVSPKDNQCLVCMKKIPSFSLGGVIRHAITCLIEKWVHRNEVGETFNENNAFNMKPDKSMPVLEPIMDSYVNPAESEPDLVTSVISNAEESKEIFDESSSSSLDSSDFNHSSLDSAETLNLYRESCKSTGRRYNDKVTSLLKETLNKTHFPNREIRLELVNQTGLKMRQIEKWSQRARKKQDPYIKCVDDEGSLEIASRRNWLDMSQRKGSEKYKKRKEGSLSSNERRRVGKPVESLGSRPRSRDPAWPRRSHKRANRQRSVKAEGKPFISPGNKASSSGLSKTGDLLMPFFLRCSEPSALEVLDISTETGLHIRQIWDWFRKRRQQINSHSSEPKTLVKDPSSLNPVAVEEGQYTITSSDEESVLFQDKPSLSLQDQSARKKAAEIKKIPNEQIRSYVLNLNTKVNRLFKLFTDPLDSFRRKDILAQETELIESIGTLNNPFSYSQTMEIKVCVDIFERLLSRASSTKNVEFVKELMSFTNTYLNVWTPVMLYASILEIRLEKAVDEIYTLSLSRGEKKIKNVWVIPSLLEDETL